MEYSKDIVYGDYDPHANLRSDVNGNPTPFSEYVDLNGVGSVPDNSKTTIRVYRDALLASSDWTQAADSPLSDDKKAEWATYRQELRDITSIEDLAGVHDTRWPVTPV
jgi:nitrous oxide reductase accessory protein NosL